MAYRFILNETSYHGHGAVNEIVTEVKSRGFKKKFRKAKNSLDNSDYLWYISLEK